MFEAIPTAGPAVAYFIDRLNDHVLTPVIKYPPTGQGKERAAARLNAKRKANAKIPETARITRQQRRFEARRIVKRNTPTPAERARLAMEAWK